MGGQREVRKDIVEYRRNDMVEKNHWEELESVKLVPKDDAQNEAGTRFHQDL